ncbi:MAG TPA: hypothetical protein PLD14_01390 [Candidatus Pacearchaeota archaeon]|nr:hypothetical protein [Candidatus Pacearchaeota archaeon]HPR79853.1 hypothetical protein [Candidatus Pacearchaeota archaeon]
MDKEDIIDYFLGNIFEAESAYYAWRTSKFIEKKESIERINKIRSLHAEFFSISTKALLIMWVILICHIDDKRDDSISLDKADKEGYKIFFEENKKIIEEIKKVRHKVFAHKEINDGIEKIMIPPIDELDCFFENLEKFYNELSYKIKKSSVIFDNAHDFDRYLEDLYANLERGEKLRIDEINKEYGIIS